MGELQIYLGALIVFAVLVMDIQSRFFRYTVLLVSAAGTAYLYTLISNDVIVVR